MNHYKAVKQIKRFNEEGDIDEYYTFESDKIDILQKFEEIRDLIENKEFASFIPLELYSLGNELLDDKFNDESIIIPQLYIDMIFPYG